MWFFRFCCDRFKCFFKNLVVFLLNFMYQWYTLTQTWILLCTYVKYIYQIFHNKNLIDLLLTIYQWVNVQPIFYRHFMFSIQNFQLICVMRKTLSVINTQIKHRRKKNWKSLSQNQFEIPMLYSHNHNQVELINFPFIAHRVVFETTRWIADL